MSGTTSTAQTIQQYYQNILFRTGSLAEVQAWTNLVTNQGLTLATVESDFVASAEAQTFVDPIVQFYAADLGRAPDAAGLAAWVHLAETGVSMATINADIQASAEGQAYIGTSGTFTTASATTFVTKLYSNILNRTPDAAGLSAWVSALTGGTLTAAQVENDIRTSVEGQADLATASNNYLLQVGAGGTVTGNIFTATGAPGTNFTLTTGPDIISLTGNNNTITGTSNGVGQTYTAGDTISAASGSTGNTLSLADIGTGGQWSPLTVAGITVSGIQTLNLTSTEGVVANTASNIQGFSGVTALNVKDASGAAGPTLITAAGTTAVTLTDVSAGASTDTVAGGSTVTVTSTTTTGGGAITVGSAAPATVGTTATAPTGAIVVTENTNVPLGGGAAAIWTTGGTTVTITENLNTADTTGVATVVGGPVNVTGTAATTSVTVNQTAAATAAAGPPAVEGVVDGVVNITDANAGSTTKANTIATVSLNNFGNTVINDNALSSLSLSGTGGSVAVNDVTSSSTATTLALAVSALTDAGIYSDGGQVTTLNITTGGASASTLGGIVDAALTTLAVSGTQQLTIAGPVGGPTLASVTVSGSAGLGISLGTGTTFTSTSTGTDVVTIAAAATKTITGNGTANEEIVWNGAASPGTTLGSTISGFKVLGIGSAVAGNQTFDMSKLTGFTSLDVKANGVAGTIQLINVTAGTPLSIDGVFTGTLVYQTADTAGPTDNATVTLGASSNKAGFLVNALTLEDSSLNGIGSVTFTSNASTKAAVNTIGTLNDGALSSLTVAGTGGLTIAGPLTDTATSLAISGSSTGTGGINLVGISDSKLATLTLSGTDNISIGPVVDGTSGITVSGGGFNANATLTLLGATASGKTDSISLGNGTNVVTDGAALAGSAVNITVGTGANTVSVGGAATNNVTFGSHTTTTVDSLVVGPATSATVSPQAIVAGLNASGADTITFAGDAGATGAITAYTAAQINTLGSNPTTLAQAVNGILAGGGGIPALAQHGIGEFQFQGNTYFLEQAGATGSAFAVGDTLVQLSGSVTFTTATTATTGVLHLHG